MQVRINKYISDKKICSRREADRLIKEGKVFVNGKPAKIGQKIDPTKDKVEVKKQFSYKYYIFYKPKGVLSHRLQHGQKDAISLAGLSREFAVVGRLDKDSEGLLFITNDGRIVNKLLNPKFGHEREYEVQTNKPIKDSDIKKLEKGVNIEGYKTLPAKAKRISQNKIKLILYEGKKHQIRRMLTALGYSVVNLKRVRILNLDLGNLKPGEKRQIKGKQLQEFLSFVGIENTKQSYTS